jgi:replicative DNA helicase
MNDTRIPPQNLDAERAVLGAMLVDDSIVPEMTSVLKPKDFYLTNHGQIFTVIKTLADQRIPVDLLTVGETLKKSNSQILSADLAAFADMALPSHVHRHADMILEAARKRRLLTVVREAETDLYESAEDSLSIASRMFASITTSTELAATSFIPVAEVMKQTIKELDRIGEECISGIPTGLKRVDDTIGGIQRGELVIIAGRPSMGKTALAQKIALGAANAGLGVAFVSCESKAEKIGQRIVAGATGIENRDLRRGRLTPEQVRALIQSAAEIGNLPIYFLDTERAWDKIKARIMTLKRREPKISLAILDYVGLVSAPVSRGERYLELGRISSESKALAMELDIAFVLLSQLNREVESRDDRRPRLSDLRESGNLEQDADIVGILFRESYYNDDFRPRGLAELNIAKNRDGATGVIKLAFDEKTVSFRDWE